MLKKLLSVVFALFVSVAFFAGCNIVKVNNSAYYTQVVAEVIYKDNTPTKQFTMKDLLTAYSSYGSQYTQQGASVKDAVNSTLETMIDRYLLISELRKASPLTEADKNDVMRKVYTNINQSLQELETEVRKSWGLEVTDVGSLGDKTTTLRAEYKPHEATIELVYNEEALKHELLKKVTEPTDIDGTNPGSFVYFKTDEQVSNEAWKRYIRRLKNSAEMEGKTGLSDQKLLNDEISRIYRILEDNEYLSRFSNSYYNNLPLNVNTNNVVAYYKQLFTNDYNKYANNLNAYHTQMRSDATKVYYHPQTNLYLNVTHILVKLSASDNAEFVTLEKDYNIGKITKAVYDEQVASVKARTTVTYEERDQDNQIVIDPVTGKAKVVTKLLTEVYNTIIVPKVETYNKDTNFVARANAFNDLIYMLNDDEGIMNRDTAYVVNLTDVQGQKNIMIEEFTNASRTLFTGLDKDGNQLPQSQFGKGAISEPVFAEFKDGEFGFHIIMNLGVVENPIVNHKDNLFVLDRIGSDGQEDGWLHLYNVTTQPSSTKTLFEVVNDALNLSEYTNLETEIVNTAKGNVKEIKTYNSRFKNLWE